MRVRGGMRQPRFLTTIGVLGVSARVAFIISTVWALLVVLLLDIIGGWAVSIFLALMLFGLVGHLRDLRALQMRGYQPADVRERFHALSSVYDLYREEQAAMELSDDEHGAERKAA